MDRPHRSRDEVIAALARKPGAAGPAFRERTFRHAKDPAERPKAPPSNGGPKIYETPVEEMRDIGQTLYAPDPWIPKLARDLGEHPRQVRRWVNGEAQMPPVVLQRARMVLDRHLDRVLALRARLGMADRDDI